MNDLSEGVGKNDYYMIITCANYISYGDSK